MTESKRMHMGVDNQLEFLDFVMKYGPAINEIGQILEQPVGTEPPQVLEQIGKAENFYAFINYLLAYAEAFLDTAESTKLDAKSELFTDLDRKSRLQGKVAQERKFRNILAGYAKAVEVRVEWGRSVLSFEKARMEKELSSSHI